jgi:hypothetical protein
LLNGSRHFAAEKLIYSLGDGIGIHAFEGDFTRSTPDIQPIASGVIPLFTRPLLDLAMALATWRASLFKVASSSE